MMRVTAVFCSKPMFRTGMEFSYRSFTLGPRMCGSLSAGPQYSPLMAVTPTITAGEQTSSVPNPQSNDIPVYKYGEVRSFSRRH